MKKLLLITVLCLFIGGCGRYTKINILVVDEGQRPISGANIKIGYSTGGSYSLWKLTSHMKNLVTDDGGLAFYRAFTIAPIFGSVKMDGYYETNFRLNKNHFKHGFKDSFDEPLIIVLKKRKVKVPMYAKEAKVSLPSDHGSFGYDLTEGDLVEPNGRGKVSDFIFDVALEEVVTKQGSYKRPSLNVRFSNEDDGIIPFLEWQHAIQHSELKSSQEAPNEGYLHTLASAKETINDNYFKYDINYYIKVRTKDKPMYGKVYYDFVPGITSKGIVVEFIYYLNPDGTRNIEFDIDNNLLRNIKEQKLEYSPRRI